MLLDPGVPHRDSFAKYAAAFFTISRSSLALASSRRSRETSASSSLTPRFIGTAAPAAPLSLPARLNRIQFHKLESGMPSRFAAWLPPIDSASRTASSLNSSVYCRFGTDSFLPISSSVHQKPTSNLMYVNPRQGHMPAIWDYVWSLVWEGFENPSPDRDRLAREADALSGRAIAIDYSDIRAWRARTWALAG